MTEFDAALERIYHLFAIAPPERVDLCPCCLDESEARVILTTPLRILSDEQLGKYASNVLSTVGDVADYRYFLPRMLECSALNPDWWPSPEIVIGRLSDAGWTSWSAAERDAITAFLSAWFDRWAAGPAGAAVYGEVDGVLCGLARAKLDIEPFLERLRAPENARGLAELRSMHAEAAEQDVSPDAFWETVPEAWKQVKSFLYWS